MHAVDVFRVSIGNNGRMQDAKPGTRAAARHGNPPARKQHQV
jgi:hypothetical protein